MYVVSPEADDLRLLVVEEHASVLGERGAVHEAKSSFFWRFGVETEESEEKDHRYFPVIDFLFCLI